MVPLSTRVMAIVKADAYGHGMLEVAKTCLEAGASYLGVATLDEALTLRKAGINSPILVLGYVPDECAELAVKNRIDITVYNLSAAQALSKAAVNCCQKAYLHIKIDTGMGRIGFQADTYGFNTIKKIAELPAIVLQGVFSHFAVADMKDKSFTMQQLDSFKSFVGKLENVGIKIALKHIANSAAIIDLPESYFDMVRAGIIIYGVYPSSEVQKERLQLLPAMRLKSRISHLKTFPAGQSVSYGRTYISKTDIKVATVPIGYADGYSRLFSNRAWATVRGIRVPLIGRVCMDQCMFDVSKIEELKEGDEIILFGREEDGITADQLAAIMGTINYEILCSPGRRVPRIYIE